MVDGGDLSNWTSVVSVFFGGFFWAYSYLQGKYARRIITAQRVNKLDDLKDLAKGRPFLIAVNGRAWSDSPLDSELTDAKAVIAKLLAEEHIMKKNQSNQWVKDTQQVRNTTREARWCINDGSRTRLPVIDAGSASELTLLPVGDVYEPALQRLQDVVARTFGGWHVLGTRKVERLLPHNTMLTAVGEVNAASDLQGTWARMGAVQLPNSQVLVLKPPKSRYDPFILSSRPLEEIIAQHQRWAKLGKYFAIGFTVVAVGMLTSQALHGLRAKLRARRVRRRQASHAQRLARQARERQPEPSQQAQQSATEQLATLNDVGEQGEGLCTVCFERRSDMVFTSCGHMCTCQRCTRNLTRCPMCRSASKSVRVYSI